jgi:peptidoglycan-N-acetylglucosamine deacetylase
VALTFDDGISDYTDELLDILEQNNVKATFFILGQSLQSNSFYKRTLIRMVREGHIVASHSFDHPDLTTLSRDQIKDQLDRTDDVIQSIIGIRPRFMRPPYGYVNQRVVNTLRSHGYLIINWNHDTNDWKFQDNYGTIVGYVQNQISSPKHVNQGPIILQHDSLQSSTRLQSGIIKILRKKGYEFVTMYECIGQEPYRH